MNPASAKAKGRETENRLAVWLTAYFGRTIERKRQRGARDEGDLTGLHEWTMEVKSSTTRLAEGMQQAHVEWMNTLPRPRWFVLFARLNRESNPRNWYAVMPVWQWAEIARELRHWRKLYGSPEYRVHQDRT